MIGFPDVRQYALDLNHALLGVISSNFRAVSVGLHGPKVVIQVVLEAENDDDMKEIRDMETDFEGMVGPIDFEVEVAVSKDPIMMHPPDAQRMFVFRRRED